MLGRPAKGAWCECGTKALSLLAMEHFSLCFPGRPKQTSMQGTDHVLGRRPDAFADSIIACTPIRGLWRSSQ
jgi:hypothetical protein